MTCRLNGIERQVLSGLYSVLLKMHSACQHIKLRRLHIQFWLPLFKKEILWQLPVALELGSQSSSFMRTQSYPFFTLWLQHHQEQSTR